MFFFGLAQVNVVRRQIVIWYKELICIFGSLMALSELRAQKHREAISNRKQKMRRNAKTSLGTLRRVSLGSEV